MQLWESSSAPATAIAFKIGKEPEEVLGAIRLLESFKLVGHIDSGIPHVDATLAHSGSVYYLTGDGWEFARQLTSAPDTLSTMSGQE